MYEPFLVISSDGWKKKTISRSDLRNQQWNKSSAESDSARCKGHILTSPLTMSTTLATKGLGVSKECVDSQA